MSLYDEMCKRKADVDKQVSGGDNSNEWDVWDTQSLIMMSMAEDLHRIADALEPLNTMGDFNRNMEELRDFFKTKEAEA